MRRRSGFTVIEISVFTAVGLLVLAAVWSIFGSSIRKGKATDRKVIGLQTNLLAARSLERDLEHLYEDETRRIEVAKVPQVGLELRFYRYHESASENAGSSWGTIPLQRVLYRYVAAEKKIYRIVDGGTPRPLFGLFETFGARDAEQEAGILGTSPKAGASLVYYFVSTPEEVLRMPLEKRDEDHALSRTVLVGGMPRQRIAAKAFYSYWNAAPYAPAPLTP